MSPSRLSAGEDFSMMLLISEISSALGMAQVSSLLESLETGAARLAARRRERQPAKNMTTILTGHGNESVLVSSVTSSF